jgi:uncharacterized repeat protein (TIGR03843 family)
MPSQPWLPERPDIFDLLREGRQEEAGLLASGSNYVFLLSLSHPSAGTGYAIYKPQKGEAPLSDFPDGTLYRRELAAYIVSEAIGWHLIPPTLVRDDGLEMGKGVVQLFIEHDPALHYFNIKNGREDEMKRVAVFDWLTNNADRKGGHCLIAADGRLWCIDQGLTFHVEDKLRTVIWDYQGQPVPQDLIDDVCRFGEQLASDADLRRQLEEQITPKELRRLEERAAEIDDRRVFPPPPPYRPYPWPMI